MTPTKECACVFFFWLGGHLSFKCYFLSFSRLSRVTLPKVGFGFLSGWLSSRITDCQLYAEGLCCID